MSGETVGERRWDALVIGGGIAGLTAAWDLVRAGAAAAQLFDSWAGSLSPRAYRERVAPYSALALDVARQAVSPTTGESAPLIHFGTGTARLLGLMRQAGADAVGVDERIELGEAIEALAGADPQAGACPV